MKTFKEFNEKSKGLYYNIHKRRKSGKRMRKKGEKGAPKPGDLKGQQVSQLMKALLILEMKQKLLNNAYKKQVKINKEKKLHV